MTHNGEVGGPQAHSGSAPPPAAQRGTEGRPQWVAIPAQNARRTALIVVLVVVALFVGTWMFSSLGSFLFLLLLAWLLSVAMEPPVLWLSNRGLRRGRPRGS